MKKLITQPAMAFLILLTFSTSVLSCTKAGTKPGSTNNGSNSGGDTGNNGTHIIDPKMVGTWMWTDASDGAYYDDNGTYNGPANGLATEYKIGADGYGTCYNHYFSSIGLGTYLEVNISYKGFFESDSQGHLGFFPTSGTYESTNSGDRNLRSDELWNEQTSTGRSFVYQDVTVTTQGGRNCFQTTSTSGIVDTYFKIP